MRKSTAAQSEAGINRNELLHAYEQQVRCNQKAVVSKPRLRSNDAAD